VPQQVKNKTHHSISSKDESSEESGLDLNFSTGWAMINFDHSKINRHNSFKFPPSKFASSRALN